MFAEVRMSSFFGFFRAQRRPTVIAGREAEAHELPPQNALLEYELDEWRRWWRLNVFRPPAVASAGHAAASEGMGCALEEAVPPAPRCTAAHESPTLLISFTVDEVFAALAEGTARFMACFGARSSSSATTLTWRARRPSGWWRRRGSPHGMAARSGDQRLARRPRSAIDRHRDVMPGRRTQCAGSIVIARLAHTTLPEVQGTTGCGIDGSGSSVERVACADPLPDVTAACRDAASYHCSWGQ